jgi:hypothetical protein
VLAPVMNALATLFPPPASLSNRSWLSDTEHVHVATAPLLGMIAVADLYDRASAIEAGRLWQRLHLIATASGLAAQPLNQLAERVDREAELRMLPTTAEALASIIGTDALRPTFLFRMGYPRRQPPHSPRRPLTDVLQDDRLEKERTPVASG